MVVLAASICTRGGKAILSRQFREISRQRVEALLSSFPRLADAGTQHTTVEQDNVRYVYQPLDELYMVLITNRQSNILQDIDSLHLFAQIVSTICKSLDEREILRNAYELLSAFDEVVTLGYRENLSIAQIKTFLEMESHEERIQEIIAKNKELEATEARKDAAKRLEMQRRQMAKSGRNAAMPPTQYPTYTPPPRPAVTDTFDSYEAEKNKTFNKTAAKGKGMQLGKKSKTTDMFERVRGDMGVQAEDISAPLISTAQKSQIQEVAPTRVSMEKEAIGITISEKISAKISREGQLKSFGVNGDLQLKITDPSLTKVKLDLDATPSHGAQFRTHPKVDKALFNSSRAIQLRDATSPFPVNNSVGVLRWTVSAAADANDVLPITFTVWVNKGSDDSFTITVEYELTSEDTLNDVVVLIPFTTTEPVVASFDAIYEVTGDSVEWKIGPVDSANSSGSFEFEAQTDDESEFFPMKVTFSKNKPFVDVDVTSVTLIDMGEELSFSKDIKSIADNYTIE